MTTFSSPDDPITFTDVQVTCETADCPNAGTPISLMIISGSLVSCGVCGVLLPAKEVP